MKIKLFKSINDVYYKVNDFPDKSKILLISGLSGSGKSYLARDIAKKHSAIIFQVEWLKHSTHVSDDCKYILDSFLDKHPDIIPLVQNKWNDTKIEDKNELFKKYINLFLLHFLEVRDPSKNYIIEGLQLFTLIDFELIKNYPIIIKGTSSYNSFKNRFKRDYQKRKDKPFIVKLKFVFRVVKESFLYQLKHRKLLNKFLEKFNREKNNGK